MNHTHASLILFSFLQCPALFEAQVPRPQTSVSVWSTENHAKGRYELSKKKRLSCSAYYKANNTMKHSSQRRPSDNPKSRIIGEKTSWSLLIPPPDQHLQQSYWVLSSAPQLFSLGMLTSGILHSLRLLIIYQLKGILLWQSNAWVKLRETSTTQTPTTL